MGYEGPHPILVSAGGLGVSTVTGVITNNGGTSVTGNTLTQYSTLSGGASSTINNIAPSATTGYGLCSNGATSQPTYQNIPGTSLVLLSSQTIVTTSGVTFTSLITSTYPTYLLYFSNLKNVTNARRVAMYFSANNGSTWLGANYIAGAIRSSYNSTTFSATARTDEINFCVSQTNAVICSGYLFMYNFATNNIPVVVGQYTTTQSAAVRTFGTNSTTGINAISIQGIATNISGTFTLYGVKQS